MITQTYVNSGSQDENNDINQKSTYNNRGNNENSNDSNNSSFIRDSILTTEPSKEEQHQNNCIESNQEEENKKSISSSCETGHENDKQCVVNNLNKISTTKKAKQKYGKRDRAEDTEEDKEWNVDVRNKKMNKTTKRKEEQMFSTHNLTTSKLEHSEQQETTVTKKKSKNKEKITNCNNQIKNDEIADKCFNQFSTKLNREEYISEKQQSTSQSDEQHQNLNESKFANFALLNAFGWEMCGITSLPASEATSNERRCGYDTVKWTYTLRHVANKEILVLEVLASAYKFSSSLNNHIHENKQQTSYCSNFIDNGKIPRKVNNCSTYECVNKKGEWVFTTYIESINGEKFTSQYDAVLFLLSKSITAMISAHGANKNLSGKEEFMETSRPTHLLSENNNRLLHINISSFLASEWEHSIGTSDEENNNIIITKIDHNADCTRYKSDLQYTRHCNNRESAEKSEQQHELEEEQEEEKRYERNNTDEKFTREHNVKTKKFKNEEIKEEVREENLERECQVYTEVTAQLITSSTIEEKRQEKLTSCLELPRNFDSLVEKECAQVEEWEKELYNTQERSTLPVIERACSSSEEKKETRATTTTATTKDEKRSEDQNFTKSHKMNKAKQSKQICYRKNVPEERSAEVKHTHLSKTNITKQEEQQSQLQHQRLQEKREQQQEQKCLEKNKYIIPSLRIKKEQQMHVCTSSRKTFHFDLGHNLQPLSRITTISGITFDNDKEREIELLNASDEPFSSVTSLEETCENSRKENTKANHVDIFENNIFNVKESLSSSVQYLNYVRSFSHDLNEILQCINCTENEFCSTNCLPSLNKQENNCACMETEYNESNIINNTMSRCQEEQESEEQKQISSFADTMAHSLAEVVGSEELSGDALYAGVSALNQYYSEREREEKKTRVNFNMSDQNYELEDESGCTTSDIVQKDFSKVGDDVYSVGMWNNYNNCNLGTHSICSPSASDSEVHKMCKCFPQPRRHTFLPIHGKVLRALQHNTNYTVSQFHGHAKSFDILPNGIPLAPRIVIPRTYHRRHEWILHMTNSQDKTEVDNDMDCSVKMNASREHVSFAPNPEYDIWEYVHRRFGRIENSATVFNQTSKIKNSQNNKLIDVDVDVDNDEDSVNKEKNVNRSSEECLSTNYSHGNNKKEKKAIDMDRYLRANRDKIMPVPMPDVEWFYSDVESLWQPKKNE